MRPDHYRKKIAEINYHINQLKWRLKMNERTETMNWITEEQAQVVAKEGLLPALKHSHKHHKQGHDAPKYELIKAINNDFFHVGPLLCALCQCYDVTLNCSDTKKCPLKTDDTQCCAEWRAVKDAFWDFKYDFSNKNLETFQQAEGKLCARLQAEIDKGEAKLAALDKVKVRHLDYGYTQDGSIRIAIKHLRDGKIFYSTEHYEYSNLPDGKCSGRLDEPGAIILGNLADELLRYIEDFKTIKMDIGHKEFVEISHIQCPLEVWMRTESISSHLTPDQAIELGHTLVHAAVAVKREER